MRESAASFIQTISLSLFVLAVSIIILSRLMVTRAKDQPSMGRRVFFLGCFVVFIGTSLTIVSFALDFSMLLISTWVVMMTLGGALAIQGVSIMRSYDRLMGPIIEGIAWVMLFGAIAMLVAVFIIL